MLSVWFSLFSLLFVCRVWGSLLVGVDTDCSNSTHRWTSKNDNCFDDEAGAIPYVAPVPQPNAFGRYLGGLGLTPRDGNCAPDETSCWIVNCCQPGETCGAITIGCVASWSTIYTTTTTTSWSTIVDVITPEGGVSYTTATISTTSYVTSYNQVTLPGPGLDTVVVTTTTTSTSLVLSAYTPPTATVTLTGSPAITQAPEVKRSGDGGLLPRADLPRRQARTSYTTLTVYVTSYYTAYSTSTLDGNLVTTTKAIPITSTATRNQTHYATPTEFTTITQTITNIVPSYAFGTLQQLTTTITASLSSSIVAGTSPTDSSDETNQTNPPGAYPKKSHGLSKGAIAGLVVGIILALVLIALIVGLCCCFRRRRRRNNQRVYLSGSNRSGSLSDIPSPPSAPTPQPAMSSATPSPPYLNNLSNSPVSPTSPVMVGALPLPARAYHSNGNGNGSRHAGRKSSRSSIVSITPVPEEDEEDDDEITRVPTSRRNSGDSTRSWGRGYGGRGGYYGGRGADPRSRNNGSNSPTNPAFRGAIRSTYSDESLIPPHAR